MSAISILTKRAFLVRVRRGEGWNIKPGAEQYDGKIWLFQYGWTMTEEDSSIYSGEAAWIPISRDWPKGAPRWIASGDLADVPSTLIN